MRSAATVISLNALKGIVFALPKEDIALRTAFVKSARTRKEMRTLSTRKRKK